MISRREEAMAAETLLTNGCVMKHITDDPSKPEEKEIRFYDGDEKFLDLGIVQNSRADVGRNDEIRRRQSFRR